MNKFEAPQCKNCSKRWADRICINKACGDGFMSIICGKCHGEAHL